MSVQDEAKKIADNVIKWRRTIHANPELGLETPETESS